MGSTGPAVQCDGHAALQHQRLSACIYDIIMTAAQRSLLCVTTKTQRKLFAHCALKTSLFLLHHDLRAVHHAHDCQSLPRQCCMLALGLHV